MNALAQTAQATSSSSQAATYSERLDSLLSKSELEKIQKEAKKAAEKSVTFAYKDAIHAYQKDPVAFTASRIILQRLQAASPHDSPFRGLPFLQESFPGGHFARAASLENLALLDATLGKNGEAIKDLAESRRQREIGLRRIFTSTGEADRLAWMTTFDPFSGACALGDGAELAACALRFKGTVLDSVAEDREALATRGDGKTQLLVAKLSALRADLRQAILDGDRNKISKDDPNSKIEEADKIEEQLAQLVTGYGTARRSLLISLADVQKVLPHDAALVEMVTYWHYPSVEAIKNDPKFQSERSDLPTPTHYKGNLPFLDPKIAIGMDKVDAGVDHIIELENRRGQKAVRCYAAAVIRHEGKPVFVDLGVKTEIDQQLDKVRAGIARVTDLENQGQQKALEAMEAARADKLRGPCQALHRLLIEPLEKAVRGEMVSTWIFSPDGQLNFLPFSALIDERGRYLCQRYGVRVVSSGRDLLREPEKTPRAKNHAHDAAPQTAEAVLVGDPDFSDPGPHLALEQGGRNNKRLPDNLLPLMTMNRGPRGMKLGRLFGSGEEVDTLAGMFRESGWKVRLLKHQLATEAALGSLRGPRVLHIATHGFFLNEDQNTADSGGRNAIKDGFEDLHGAVRRLESPDVNPMLRAGLALTGAQTTFDLWTKDQIPPSNQDGVLMAAEVAELNLHGTDLVVLSACDTAQGEPRDGEGVLGLRRAFIVAGARNLLMTLWPVNDQVTRDTMIEFYRRILAGEDPSRALNQIQSEDLPIWEQKVGFDLAVRYVAPFVLTGMGNPAGRESKDRPSFP